MPRNVLAVLGGIFACWVGFFVLAQVMALAWPDYASHARDWVRRDVFTFPAGMACLNLLFWAVSFVAAGWAAGRIARDRRAVWVLAAVMLFYAAYVHLLRGWASFPWWYNLAVVGLVVPAVWWGASRARQRAS